jgi:hypothetical protein
MVAEELASYEEQAKATLSRPIAKIDIELGGGKSSIQPQRILELHGRRSEEGISACNDARHDSSQTRKAYCAVKERPPPTI